MDGIGRREEVRPTSSGEHARRDLASGRDDLLVEIEAVAVLPS
jgi:hypothetical protein